MADRVFVAGASGAIGTALVPLLIATGYTVFGSTRRVERAKKLEEAGVTPVVVDVFDALALRNALLHIAPQTVIHQLTDLPPGLDPARMAQAVTANARIRDEGTRNLVAAAVSAGSSHMIAQSIAHIGPARRLTTKAARSTSTRKVRAVRACGVSPHSSNRCWRRDR
jgi:nucleoside-diphosphate-sugar epimerase